MDNFLKRRILPFAALLLVTVACTERIHIKTDDAPLRLVVYGYITTDTIQHSIRVTRSAGYFTTESPEGVSNAVVTITDNNGKKIQFVENDTVSGLYQTDPDVYGEEGKTYTLDVYVNYDDDRVQEHYRSEAYLQPVHHIDSVRVGRAPYPMPDFLVEVRLYAWNYGENNTYTIFVLINDSLVNSTIDDYFLINDGMFKDLQYIDGVGCYYLYQREQEYGDERVKKGDKITLNMNAISNEYANFIRSVQSEIRGTNPIFGGPPANVPTNIRLVSPQNGTPALGFFTAFPSRYAHTTAEEDYSLD